MASSLLLVADLTARKATSSVGGGAFTFPALTGGEDLSIALRFSQSSGGSAYEVFPNIRSLRASIALTDTAPKSGTFALKIGAGASTTANTTPDIPFNVTPSGLKATLDALPVLSGAGVNSTAWTDGNAIVVSFSDGSERVIAAARNDLDPSSLIRVRTNPLSEGTEHEITILQTPIASSDTFDIVVPPQPTVELVIQASTDPSGVFKYPCIQNIIVPATFQGTYRISYGYSRTAILSPSDGIDVIQAAINAMFTQSGQSVVVTNPEAGVAQVSFNGRSFIGIEQPLLSVSVISAPPGNKTVALSLDTPACFAALRAADMLKGYYLEIVADICEDGVDPSTASTWQTVPLFRQPVTIQRPINWPGLEASTPIDWSSPGGPATHIPFGANNIITGQQFYVQPLGNATSLSFDVVHNLGTKAIHLSLWNNDSSGSLLRAGVDYLAEVSNDNAIALSFPSIPGSAAVTAVISTAGPKAAFMEGLTVTKAQVIGLLDQLDGLQSTVLTLSGLIPSLSDSGAGQTNSDNGIVIPLQQISEVIGYKGSVSPDAALGLKDSQLPMPHALAPSSKFDKELWRVAVNDKMFALGRKLTIDWGVSLQLLRANCAAEYKMVVEKGEYSSDGSYLNVNWNTTAPVISQPIVLTDEMTVHSFGIQMNRGIVGTTDTITLTQQLYGIATGNNTAAPSNANFAIRSRIISLETESVTPAKGWISYGVVPSITPIDSTSGGCAAVVST